MYSYSARYIHNRIAQIQHPAKEPDAVWGFNSSVNDNISASKSQCAALLQIETFLSVQ